MKLFDYKFLILLGLTLVVYFMYRELLDLKKKIKELDSKNSVNPVNSIDDMKDNNLINFQIPLPPKIDENIVNFENTLENIPYKENLDVIKEESSESEEIDDQIVEQIAIYSNDNENDKTNSYSIGDSSELISEDVNPENDEKKKISLVKSEGDDEITKLIENVDFDETSPFLENNEVVKLDELSGSELMKYKLNELQCFAEENSIEIIKDKKGKKKTKGELANDLVNHFKNKKKNISAST